MCNRGTIQEKAKMVLLMKVFRDIDWKMYRGERARQRNFYITPERCKSCFVNRLSNKIKVRARRIIRIINYIIIESSAAVERKIITNFLTDRKFQFSHHLVLFFEIFLRNLFQNLRVLKPATYQEFKFCVFWLI